MAFAKYLAQSDCTGQKNNNKKLLVKKSFGENKKI